jgi:hypothetical protein
MKVNMGERCAASSSFYGIRVGRYLDASGRVATITPAQRFGGVNALPAAAVKYAGSYPKSSELCLRRVKPGETLVEARSGSDVQIDRQTWA